MTRPETGSRGALGEGLEEELAGRWREGWIVDVTIIVITIVMLAIIHFYDAFIMAQCVKP